jgi:hypothetical protein
MPAGHDLKVADKRGIMVLELAEFTFSNGEDVTRGINCS